MKRIFFTLAVVTLLSLMAAVCEATNFLEEEAGICAYTNAGRSIDFAKVKPIYRTIEYEMSDYIIGSVPVADYPETEDVHVFVSKDGWVAAYYPANDPVSKIIDFRNYKGTELIGTKLELALKKVADTINFPLVNIKYYDFVCPQATNLMIVIDSSKGVEPDSFDIMIPSDIIVYERSFGQYGLNYYGGTFRITLYIGNNEISSCDVRGYTWDIKYGKLSPEQLKQGMFYTVEIKSNYKAEMYAGGIAIVYQKP